MPCSTNFSMTLETVFISRDHSQGGGHKNLPLYVCLSAHSSHFTVKSLCNQLLPNFSMIVFEALHSYCGHNADVCMGF